MRFNQLQLKKYLIYVVNFLMVGLLGLALYSRVPAIYNNSVLEKTKIGSTEIRRLSGENLTIPDIRRNKVVIFWATWCGPCHYEMKKLNKLLTLGKIRPDNVIAISIDQNRDEVIKFIEAENYQFLVAHDFDGSLARKFNITSTPTVLFVNKDSTIDWMTSGISPTLESRIQKYLMN